jgi:hypothetical protein
MARTRNPETSTGYHLVVMAGHSRPKDGVLAHAYVPAIHVFLFYEL